MDAERSLVVQKFRTLAETFMRLAAGPGPDPTTPVGRSVCQRDYHANDQAGKLAILAFRRGWLKIPGLDVLVAEIDNPPAPPLVAQCLPVYCPSNLFSKLAGNQEIPVVNEAGGLRITGASCGGILPGLYPEALPGHPFTGVDGTGTWQATCDHHAMVCKWLADAIGTRRPAKAREPLTEAQERVFQVIVAEGPIQGSDICKRTGDEQSTLTSHIIPALKKLRGVKNKRGAGYYAPNG